MDNRQGKNESLKNTLSCYQLTSADSLSGPSSFPALAAQLWFKENNQSPPVPQPPLIQIPLLIPNDTSTKRAETTLSGHIISCFIVGGEMRLCLPQILTSVLKDFSIQEINRTCAELHIYCSRCSPEQLEILKVLGILPFNTTQCGLITKTDAERLVSTLGAECHLNAKQPVNEKLRGIPVYHECFGKGEGIFYPDLYVNPEATCIACEDCRITFSPTRFVSHTHRSFEKRTCHWGFDRTNWRHYLLVPNSIDELKYKELQKELDTVKLRFDFKAQAEAFSNNVNNSLKRRLVKSEMDDVDSSYKRMKSEKESCLASPTAAAPNFSGLSLPVRPAFKPWSTTMSALPGLAGWQAASEAAIIKALFQQDRHTLPTNLFPASPTALSSKASDWSKWTQARTEPAAALPLDLQKQKSCDSKSRREGNERRRRSPAHSSSSKQAREHRSIVKTEDVSQSGSYPTSNRRASDEPQRTSLGNDAVRYSPEARPATDPVPANSSTCDGRKYAPSSSFDAEPDGTHFVKPSPMKLENGENRQCPGKEVDESREAMLRNIAAASAMLELSSAVEERSKSNRPTSGTSDKSSSFPDVVPLLASKDRFKWNFRDISYVISSTGTKELKSLWRLFDSWLSGKSVERVLHEVVRMKFEFEEKTECQKNIQRNLESEIERLRASRQRCLDQSANVKAELRQELERVSDYYHNHIKEANDSLVSLGKSLADVQRHPGVYEERESLQHKILDRLHKQVDDKEDAVRHLEKQLLEERDRRLLAENNLNGMKEAVEEETKTSQEKRSSSASKSPEKSRDNPYAGRKRSSSPMRSDINAEKPFVDRSRSNSNARGS